MNFLNTVRTRRSRSGNFKSIRTFSISALIGVASFLMSCNATQSPPTVHGASPFDTTHIEAQVLSAEERAKLASATGKTVKPIDADALATKINNATGKLHLFCFWHLDNASSLSTLKAINALSATFDSTKLHIVFINMQSSQAAAAVNLFIRENQLTDETLMLQKADMSAFTKRLRKDFTSVVDVPLLILANKAEQILQFYNRSMDEKELSALIQPLM